MNRLIGLVLLVVALVGAGIFSGEKTYSPATSDKAEAPAQLSKEEKELKAERKKLIEELMRKGILQKTGVPGKYPRVWVRPAFYALDFDVKQNIASVVYGYYYSTKQRDELVTIYDSRSNKQVGSFSPSLGLQID